MKEYNHNLRTLSIVVIVFLIIVNLTFAYKMGKRRINTTNKIEKSILGKILCKLTTFTSILMLFLAIALLIIPIANAATVRVQSGNLNISNNLTINSNTLFVDSSTDRVGIGTASPAGLFHISDSTDGRASLNISHSGPVWGADAPFINLIYSTTTSTKVYTSANNELIISHSGSDLYFDTDSNRNLIMQTSGGNVGIGTASPNAKLTVIGGINASGGLNVTAGSVLLATESGSVGIGTTTPIAQLHVIGSVTARDSLNASRINTTNVTSTGLYVDSGTLVVDSDNNRVGIGTTNPNSLLHINRGAQEETNGIRLQNTQLGGYGSAISIYSRQNFGANADFEAGRIQVQGEESWASAGTTRSYMHFDVVQDEILQERVRITSSGRVGIGTTSPTHQLHVVGSQNLTGTLYYGALQAQSPHALIQKDSNGNLKPTEFCIVSNENNVLSLTFNDVFTPTININSTSCMNKEILVEINSTYASNSTTNETYLASQFEIREKVFTGERRSVRIY